MAKSLVSFRFNPILKPLQRSQPTFYNPMRCLAVSAPKAGFQAPGNRSLWRFNDRSQWSRGRNGTKNMDFVVHSWHPNGVPLPPGPPGSWKGWILGIVITVIIPFLSHPVGSLLKLKNQVETAVETAEEIVEAVEKVAEGVEKFAEDVLEELPKGGKLRNAVEFIENVAEATAREAHLAGDIIDKVEEAEKEVESLVDAVVDDDEEIAKAAKDPEKKDPMKKS